MHPKLTAERMAWLDSVLSQHEFGFAAHFCLQLELELIPLQAAIRVFRTVPRVRERKTSYFALARYKEVFKCCQLPFVEHVQAHDPSPQRGAIVSVSLFAAVQESNYLIAELK